MLAEDVKLLGQRQKTSLFTETTVQYAVSFFEVSFIQVILSLRTLNGKLQK
jgi:hypothetical protein